MKISRNSLSCIALALVFLLFASMMGLTSCQNSQTASAADSDSLTEAQLRMPENALKGLEVFEGLEVKVFATEPMLQNPTNIDVDERGRVWVTEAYNYRPDINSNPTTPKGDRIMILEDTDGDGQADTSKVFYQGPEIDAPLGICVLGNKVLISQSPYVWAFYDNNGDDKADRKEVFFSGIQGEQHDHGIHAFTFGADGKFYFNFGNAGETLKDKEGKDVRDQDGDVIDLKKYRQGMVFRCDTNGSHIEVLGDNFRNPYEVAVDSYGTLWQSDNDDDGNRGVRINYVMQYGNYGFTDKLTGAGWQANRTNIEDSIPYRHWHLNDPGTIPNLLQTGAGSPTGLLVYEGTLLPKEFYGQLIHCDAGPNVVRSYVVDKNGAGYSAKIVKILEGSKDKWFRPADVCVAPDGSLIIADWYDPGVGGHQAGDQVKGRIYRVAPKATGYKIQAENYSTAAGAVAALQNPNLSIRYHAFNALQAMGKTAIPELEKLWKSNADSRMRARAFWVLVKMQGNNVQQYIQEAAKDANPDIRIMAIRASTELNADVIGIIRQLVNDKETQVRRESAIALHHNTSAEAAQLWTTLATQYDGKDRWFLEALGVGADGQWDRFFKTYLSTVTDPVKTNAGKDLVWRARTDEAVPFIAQLAADQNTPLNNRLRYFRALDFNSGPAKSALLLKMIEQGKNDIAFKKAVLRTLDLKSVKQSAAAQQALAEAIQSVKGTPEYFELVNQYEIKSEKPNLLQIAVDSGRNSFGRDAARLLLKLGGSDVIMKVINGKDTTQAIQLINSLGRVGSKESIDIVQNIALSNKYPMNIRKTAAGRIGYSWSGEERVLALLKAKKVPQELIPDIVASVSYAWRGNVRAEAQSYLPDHAKSAARKAPTLDEISALKGDVSKGKAIYANLCSICHILNNEGFDFGPKLAEIGSKYAKDGLLNSIVYPSQGISFGFEGWDIKLKDGSSVTGIVSSKTETDLDVKLPGGNKQHIKMSDVSSMKEMKQSMMPEGLYMSMKDQDIADLLEFLEGLKKK